MASTNGKQRRRIGPLLLAASGLLASCVEGDFPTEIEESTGQALTVAETQARLNQLYDIDNVVKVEIKMDGLDWLRLLQGDPLVGGCGTRVPAGKDQFPEYRAAEVKISGSKYLTTPQTFNSVVIKKKSFCGSFSKSKPSIKLKFDDAAEATLGTKHLTLNNSIQDSQSYVRQTLGYYLFGEAGLPRPRANYAQVWVNGTKIENGIYINLEQVREHLLSNPANKFSYPTGGNGVYEIYGEEDFVSGSVTPTDYIGTESASAYDDCEWSYGKWVCEKGYQVDFQNAIGQIKTGMAGLSKVVDVDQFIKAYAMEFLLKHWDGYAHHHNNTYFYNDAAKTRTPSAASGQIRFKYIPSGLDMILQRTPENPASDDGRYFRLGTRGVIAKLIRQDATARNKLLNQIKTYRDTLFTRARIKGDIQAYLDKCKARIASLGFDATAGIAEVVEQLNLARSASYLVAGIPQSESVAVLDRSTGDALHPSSVLTVGGSSTDFEVVHQSYANSGADRWYFQSASSGYRVVNESSARRLHCAQSSTTSGGHRYIYATSRSASNNEQSFYLTKEGPDNYTVTGYFKMNCYSGSGVRFGTDDMASDGRQRVYQTGRDNGSWVSWY